MMRCRFCGSPSLHSDTQHKVFSPGKAAAGAVVFGAVGAAAGFIGKEKKGYRCAACGNFMDIPMDTFTGMQIDNAIRAAKKGDTALYNYFKNQYPNIETVAAPTQVATAAPVERTITAPIQTLGQEETVKRSYRYGLWLPDAPVYVESVVLKTDGKEDRMSLVAWNQSDKDIRSLYLNVIVFDDTGDEVSRCRCVYQNMAKDEDEPKRLPVDKTFPLNTDVAYRVQIEQEKVAFADGSTWRATETDKVYTLPEQPVLTEENFPRIQYVKSVYAVKRFYRPHGQQKPKIEVFMPIREEHFWLCDCGHPARIGEQCPYCQDIYENLEKAFAQTTLIEEQQKAVKARAEERTQKVLRKCEQLIEAKVTAEKDAKYDNALRLFNNYSIADVKRAKELFKDLSGWKDADSFAAKCDPQIAWITEQQKKDKEEAERRAAEAAKWQEEERIASEQRRKKAKTVGIIVGAVAFVAIILTCLTYIVFIPDANYDKAMELYNAGQYEEAIVAFEALNGYKDSEEKTKESRYDWAVKLYTGGNYAAALSQFIIVRDIGDSDRYLNGCWDRIAVRDTIAAGSDHTVALKIDGTVIAIGRNDYGQCEVSSWNDIIAISSGAVHTVGLKADGTVVAVGWNKYSQCDVSDWEDIVAITGGDYHTVGLKADGTVVATGDNEHGQCDVSEWSNITAIAAGAYNTFGLKTDGTVVVTAFTKEAKEDRFVRHGQEKVQDWNEIIAIAACYDHILGLKSNGTVVAAGGNTYGQCDVESWENIVVIATGREHSLGLKADGTVEATSFWDPIVPSYNPGQCEVAEWSKIVAIAAGDAHSVGIKEDGLAIATEYLGIREGKYANYRGQCEVSSWHDLMMPRHYYKPEM